MGDVGTIQLPMHNQHQIVSKPDIYWISETPNRFTRLRTLIVICGIIGAVIFLVALIIPAVLTNGRSTSFTTTTTTTTTTTQTTTTSTSTTSTTTST
ncbi:unnamed protein product, partial [Adineta steineri]